MKIALDYDMTYSADPEMWSNFCINATDRGHEVWIVTSRDDRYDYLDNFHPPTAGIIYCRGVAKKWFCHHFPRIDFDIWIDDKPESLFENSTASREQLDEWRENRD